MNYLEERYQKYLNCKTFGKAQCLFFLNLLKNKYTNILEVGCGRGFFSYLMLKEKKIKVKSLFCTDIFDNCQKKELSRITNNFSFTKIKESNKLPYNANLFDLVFSMDVIEHVLDDKKFVEEQLRITKPNGEIIIGTPNRFRLANIPLFISGKLQYPRKIGDDYYGDVIHLREYGKKDILSLLDIFNGRINKIEIFPCWLGIEYVNLGLTAPKGFLSLFCQFWFIKFNKCITKR